MTITVDTRFDPSATACGGSAARATSGARRQRAQRAQQLRDRNWQYIHALGFEEAVDDSAGNCSLAGAGESTPRAAQDADFYVAFLYKTFLLTREDESRLFWRMNFLKFRAAQLAQALDPRRATDAELRRVESLERAAVALRNQLVECNLRLVTSRARRFADSTGLRLDELISEGHVALLNAVEKFDFSRGNKFSTYATTAIHHQMVARLHRVRRDGDRVHLQQSETLDAVPGEGRSVESQASVAEIGRLLGAMIERLDEREQHIVRSRFGLTSAEATKTIKSIAEDFGVTKQRVQQLQVRALNKLRDMACHIGIHDADGVSV